MEWVHSGVFSGDTVKLNLGFADKRWVGLIIIPVYNHIGYQQNQAKIYPCPVKAKKLFQYLRRLDDSDY